MKEQLKDSHKFQLWQQHLTEQGLTIHQIKEIYTKYKGNGEALFALVEVDASTPEGDKIPPVCFIKGQIVSVLVCLIDKESNKKYLLMVRQRRICHGGFVFEQVAGMVDGTDDPWDVALREVEEETGLKISKSQLELLNEKPYYTTTGTSDEALFFFSCELEMSWDEIQSYHQQHQGMEHEHERIITEVIPLKEARKYLDNTSGLLNLFLYEEKVALFRT
jgi:8-oxo-dGTP pyrophosphatase MutT (NUDIX family)